MRQLFGGAVAVSTGVAALIEADAALLSRTDHDSLRIAAWTLVIFGVVFIILGLIRLFVAQTQGLIRYWAAQTKAMEEELEHRKRMEEVKRTKAREERERLKGSRPSQRAEPQTVREARRRVPVHAGSTAG
jgi:hypothetical protein